MIMWGAVAPHYFGSTTLLMFFCYILYNTSFDSAV